MRKLTLRSEALAELTTDELSFVAGGTTDLLTNACVSQRCTGVLCLLVSDNGPLCLEG